MEQNSEGDLMYTEKFEPDICKPYGYVYITTNLVTGKRYCGKHKSSCFDPNYLGSGVLLKQDIKQYGIDNFRSAPIDWATSAKELHQKEVSWIQRLNAVNSDDWYNLIVDSNQYHNQRVDEMEQLTLPTPYDTINWVTPEGYKVNAKGTWVMTKDGYKKICESAIFITQEIAHHSTGIIKNQLYVYTVGKGWRHFDWIDTKFLNNSSLMSLKLASLIPTINSVNCNHLVSYLTQFRVANHHNIQQLTSTNFTKLVASYAEKVQKLLAETKQQHNSSTQQFLALQANFPIDLQQVTWPDELVPNWETKTLEQITPNGTFTVFESIMVVTEQLIESHTGIHYLVVATLTQNSRHWKYITASRDIFATNSKITTLAKHGLMVRSKTAGAVVEYLGHFEWLNSKLILNKTLVFQPGWYKDEFILHSSSSTTYSLDSSTAYQLQHMFSQSGDRTQLIPLIQQIKHDPVATVVLGAMLAAPLVAVLGIDNIQIHVYGAAGSGKSMLNKVLYALLGNPHSLTAIPSANSTVAALEFHFASHRDLPIMIEDINTVTEEASRDIIQQLIMCFGNNSGKMRGNTEFTVSRVNELRGSLITNAEKLMTQYNSNGGSKRRVIELIVSANLITPKFAEEIVAVTRQHHGGFLEDWIHFIQTNSTVLKQTYKMSLSQLNYLGADKVPRHLQSLAATATANIWFDKLFLYPGQTTDTLMETELDKLEDILQQLPSPRDISDVERAKLLIREWLQQNHTQFVELKQYVGANCYGIETDKYIAIDPQVFKKLLNEHGFPAETIVKQLQIEGFLVRGDGHNTYTQIKVTADKKIRMVKIMKTDL